MMYSNEKKVQLNPDKLFERIIGEKRKTVNTVATEWGIKDENIAIKRYQAHMRLHHKQKYLS